VLGDGVVNRQHLETSIIDIEAAYFFSLLEVASGKGIDLGQNSGVKMAVRFPDVAVSRALLGCIGQGDRLASNS